MTKLLTLKAISEKGKEFILEQKKNYEALNRLQKLQLQVSGQSFNFSMPGFIVYTIRNPQLELLHRITALKLDIEYTLKLSECKKEIDYIWDGE